MLCIADYAVAFCSSVKSFFLDSEVTVADF